MSVALQRPDRLYALSEIIETDAPYIQWSVVAGATGYVLECSIAETFEEGAIGLTWGQINNGEKEWSEIHQTIDSWVTFHNLPSGKDFEIYRGPGIDTEPGPDRAGNTWKNIQQAEMAWKKFHRLGDDPVILDSPRNPLSWAELVVLNATGRRWDTMEGKMLTWDELDISPIADWNEFDILPPIVETNKTYDPNNLLHEWDLENKQFAYFRVKAIDSNDNESEYITSHKVLIFSRDEFRLNAALGEEYLLQIDGEKVRNLTEARFSLRYESTELLLESMIPQGAFDRHLSQALTRRRWSVPGELWFKCDVEIISSMLWEGLTVKIKVRAIKEGTSILTLDRVNIGSGRNV